MKTINNNTSEFNTAEAENILDRFSMWQIEIADYSLAFVSLSMYERYCVVNDIQIPSILYDSIFDLSQKLNIPPVISYESLILMNDLEDNPVLFSDNYSEQERFFYQTHLYIEHDIYEIFNIIQPLYNWWWVNNPDYINSYVAFVNDPINRAIHRMENLIEYFEPEAFSDMRPYFDLTNHPYKKPDGTHYPWPSWAYSAGFVFLDIVTWNKAPNLDKYSLDDTMLPVHQWNGYITQSDLDQVKSGVLEQWNLFNKAPDNYYIWKLLENLLKIRGLHMKAAMKFIWNKGMNEPWTGWSKSAKMFLRKHIRNTKNNIDKHLLTN